MRIKGVKYEKFRYRDSDCYLLTVNLAKRSIRPVPAAEQFPFQGKQPVFDAIEQGAVGCVAGGFNITRWNLAGGGVTDQPQHTFVIDHEIWTTGIGGGGFGYFMSDGSATTAKNQVQIVIWRPDGTSFEVGSVNLRHDDRIVAFTSRGGTNSKPMDGKYYTTLGLPGPWIEEGKRTMSVVGTAMFSAPAVEPDTVVLESRWPMKLNIGDEVRWVQRGVTRYVSSGWPEILHDGENVVTGLLGVPSHGPDNWLIRKNPRTALGSSKDGKTGYLLTVQGRTKESKGLRLRELGTLLKEHGAHYAVNTDGGGSAFMWIKNGGPDHGGELVASGCYNEEGTLEAGRPAHYTVACF